MIVKLRLLPAVFAALAAGVAVAEVNCNVGIEFRDDGRFRACVLNGHHRIHTATGAAVTCADGTRLEHHFDGRLERCTLAVPAVIDDRRCDAGDEAVFDAGGRLLHCKGKPSG